MGLCTEWFDVFGGIAKTTLNQLAVLCRAQRAMTHGHSLWLNGHVSEQETPLGGAPAEVGPRPRVGHTACTSSLSGDV